MTLALLASLWASESRADSGAERNAIAALTGGASLASPEETASQGGGAAAEQEGSAESQATRSRIARSHFDKGMSYRRANDSGRALIEFLKATREDPKLVEAYYEQALVFREKGFHKLAVSRLEQALAIKPKFQKARLLLATIKLEQGKVADAVEQLGESLGLPKSESTAIKPDEEPDGALKGPGSQPLILQSLHAALPLPVVAEQKPQDRPSIEAASPAPARKDIAKNTRRKKPANRRKIRELIARKYKSNHSQNSDRKNWIAKLFSWPESFKPAAKQESLIASQEEDDDLMPQTSATLKEEFRSDEDDKPSRFQSSKNLIAYNGNPEDTLDLLSDKVEREARVERAARKLEEQNAMREKQLAELNAAKAATEAAILAKKKEQERQQETARKIASRPAGLTFHSDDQEAAREQPAASKRMRSQPKAVDDEWTRRLRFLAENGTSSLKQGEAFMFSEDTGEAVLFLRDGQKIRRVIADPLDAQELIKMRRPDVLNPKEVFFNTSLAGKMLESPAPAAPPPAPPPDIEPGPSETAEKAAPPSPPSFKIEQIMENPTGFWNWAKGLVNL